MPLQPAPELSGHGMWIGQRPTLLVLTALGLTLSIVVPPAYLAGKHSEDERRLLKNYRQAMWWENYIDLTMEYANHSSEANDVIFLGDSTCMTGIQTLAFERSTGLKAYNLGPPGFIWVDGLQLVLECYLQQHPPPKVVVLAMHPSAFQGSYHWPDPSDRERFWWVYGSGSEELRPRHMNPLLDYVREGVRIAYGQVYSGVIRRTRAAGLTGQDFGERETILSQRGFLEQRAVFQGAVPATMDFPVVPQCRLQLHSLARLANERGITLMIRTTPVIGESRSDDLKACLQELEERWPSTVVCRPVVLRYDRECFRDEYHCNVRGAEQFTKAVAGEVMEVLASRHRAAAKKD